MSKDILDTPYTRGMQAYNEGLDVCPYMLYSEDYFAWFHGWHDAHRLEIVSDIG